MYIYRYILHIASNDRTVANNKNIDTTSTLTPFHHIYLSSSPIPITSTPYEQIFPTPRTKAGQYTNKKKNYSPKNTLGNALTFDLISMVSLSRRGWNILFFDIVDDYYCVVLIGWRGYSIARSVTISVCVFMWSFSTFNSGYDTTQCSLQKFLYPIFFLSFFRFQHKSNRTKQTNIEHSELKANGGPLHDE